MQIRQLHNETVLRTDAVLLPAIQRYRISKVSVAPRDSQSVAGSAVLFARRMSIYMDGIMARVPEAKLNAT